MKSEKKNIGLLVAGLILGLVVMPVVALISFGIVNTVASQIGPSASNLTSTPCTGVDDTESDSRGYAFTGFKEVDSEACTLLDSYGKVQYRDSNGSKPTQLPKDEIASGTIDIAALVTTIFRLVLYCSLCLSFVIPTIAVVWFLINMKKSDSPAEVKTTKTVKTTKKKAK